MLRVILVLFHLIIDYAIIFIFGIIKQNLTEKFLH